MNDLLQNLPPELAEELLNLVNADDQDLEAENNKALILFVAMHIEKHPELSDLFKLNEQAAIEHYECTGDIPPGIKLVKTTTREDNNVVELQVFHGKASPKQ